MKILIVENEIYLAGSIATKLADLGHECEISKTAKEAIKDENFDAVLLSTTLPGQDFYPVIERYKNAIIILLIAYISNDTVSKPIQAGASDYIQKPFMIEELVRKINHFEEHRRIKNALKSYEGYVDYALRNFTMPQLESKKLKFPLLLRTSKIGFADYLVHSYMKQAKIPFVFFPATSFSEAEQLLKNSPQTYIYLCNFQLLRPDERERFLSCIGRARVIVSTTDLEQKAPFECIDICSDEQKFSIDEIVTIDEYIRHVITTYQDRFPDTELSRKLGISRKSLWEKRKKYDIVKKK